ncbi:MAG: TonB-dependent receptor [Candidatus Marinimicrobia bacterium]|nr:TonB-dependent receptor [Candidatus Neomarinimicrobiota bacterium]
MDFAVRIDPLQSSAVEVEMRGYHFYTKNLIQWTEIEPLVYSPKNLSESVSYGSSVKMIISPRTIPVTLTIMTDQNKSRVLSKEDGYGKRLLYVPAVSHWAEISYQFGSIKGNVSYRFLGKRLYSYNSGGILNPYDRLDLSIRIGGPKLFWFRPNLDFGVRNLQDRKQESVHGYPEPGRTYFAKISTEISNPKNSIE